MLERVFPVQLVNVMLHWFRSTKACVKWACNTSNYFNIKSGCAQGSILGPKLFNLVIDGLLNRLEMSQLGCKLGFMLCWCFYVCKRNHSIIELRETFSINA